MKEIKFRGFSVIPGEGWFVGYLVKTDKECLIVEWISELGHFHTVMVAPESVGEFTGLKDKNGKEIYGGDFLGDEKGYGLVRWIDSIAAFSVVEGDGGCFSLNKGDYARSTTLQETSVLGNIYENHEHLTL
jgi:uncharacterized phage protein (TIGR01671 family)